MHAGLVTPCLLLLLTSIPAHSALSTEPSEPSEPESATTVSYWGEIPAPADSTRIRYEDTPRALWEYPVDGAWFVVRAPFEVARAGAKATMIWVDESDVIHKVRRFLFPIGLPWGLSVGASAGQVSGTTLGLSFFHDAVGRPGNRLKFGGEIGSRESSRAYAGMLFDTPQGNSIEFGGGYRLQGRARFFGLGPGSDDDSESYYAREVAWIGAEVRHTLGAGDLSLVGEFNYTTLRSRGPLSDDRSVRDTFDGRLPTGFGQPADGLGFALGLLRDTTRGDGRPLSGTVTRLELGYFTPDDESQADFFNYRAEAEAFMDLWWDRAVALRGFYSFIDSNGEAVHFDRLLTNDDPDLFRGYEDFRFRDRGITGASVEYRYPIWDYRDPGANTLDAYGFYDVGQVFGNREEIALDELTHSYGFGTRWSIGNGFVGRFEVGLSDEDTIFRLSGSQTFQYDRRAYYDGREPIPTR